MGNRNIVNGLALIGAILVLVGVTIAANTALAEDASSARSPNAASNNLGTSGKAAAEKSIRNAAADAADSIARDNKVDLEIRLLDRTSTAVVRSR